MTRTFNDRELLLKQCTAVNSVNRVGEEGVNSLNIECRSFAFIRVSMSVNRHLAGSELDFFYQKRCFLTFMIRPFRKNGR